MSGSIPCSALWRNGRVVSRVVTRHREETLIAPLNRLTAKDARPSPPNPALRSYGLASARRYFCETSALQAKGGKNKKQEQQTPKNNTSTTTSDSSRTKPDPKDPLNYSDVESAWAKGSERFIDELKKTKSGSRFNPDIIGQVRVRVDKKLNETFPLHELAAIVPKGQGRTVSILVHEVANVKAVLSAIQASPDFNQQPQRTEDNEQELVLKIEAERPEDVEKRIKDICHNWREQVRTEKHKRDAVVKKWMASNAIVLDDFIRIKKDLQKLQDKKMDEIAAKEKEALRGIRS